MTGLLKLKKCQKSRTRTTVNERVTHVENNSNVGPKSQMQRVSYVGRVASVEKVTKLLRTTHAEIRFDEHRLFVFLEAVIQFQW
jgi:hypothetical protein